jgi:hypothetical protein
MLFRSAILVLILITSQGASSRAMKDYSDSDLRQAKGQQQSPTIRCEIRTNDVTWHLKSADAAVVEFQCQGATNMSAMPSLHMIALPKKQGLDQTEYWAPFAIPGGASTKNSQKLAPAPSARLVPGRLLWAPTKSSVWPSQEFAKTVPPGEYTVQVQLEINSGETISSNEVTVTVAK